MSEGRGFKVKGNTHAFGLFLIEQLSEYGKKAVHAVCGRAVGSVELPNAVKGAVYYAVAVKYQ